MCADLCEDRDWLGEKEPVVPTRHLLNHPKAGREIHRRRVSEPERLLRRCPSRVKPRGILAVTRSQPAPGTRAAGKGRRGPGEAGAPEAGQEFRARLPAGVSRAPRTPRAPSGAGTPRVPGSQRERRVGTALSHCRGTGNLKCFHSLQTRR